MSKYDTVYFAIYNKSLIFVNMGKENCKETIQISNKPSQRTDTLQADKPTIAVWGNSVKLGNHPAQRVAKTWVNMWPGALRPK